MLKKVLFMALVAMPLFTISADVTKEARLDFERKLFVSALECLRDQREGHPCKDLDSVQFIRPTMYPDHVTLQANMIVSGDDHRNIKLAKASGMQAEKPSIAGLYAAAHDTSVLRYEWFKVNTAIAQQNEKYSPARAITSFTSCGNFPLDGKEHHTCTIFMPTREFKKFARAVKQEKLAEAALAQNELRPAGTVVAKAAAPSADQQPVLDIPR